ncbi:MAG: dipeptide epimerase, partial [Planctomycetota bacterium]
MKINDFEILTVDIPMRMSVEHALATRSVARNIIVAAHDEDGAIGWGESCPRDYVTGESLVSVR